MAHGREGGIRTHGTRVRLLQSSLRPLLAPSSLVYTSPDSARLSGFSPSDRATPSKIVQRLRYKTGGRRRHGSAAQPDETVRREGTTAGQPAIRFHDSRHTAASILLARGVHVKLVSEMLRHSTIVLTLDTYSHVISAMHADAAAAMDAVFTD